MASPLFSPQENAAFRLAYSAKNIDQKMKKAAGGVLLDWELIYAEREQLQLARKVKTVERAQERYEEYLNALLVVIGSRGAEYVDFFDAFVDSDSSHMSELLLRYNTPESRRDLYTLLKAIAEIPKSWGASAFIRFLRGNGKQKNTPYHGAGRFSADYGWKASEVEAVSRVIVGVNEDNPYATVMLSMTLHEEVIPKGHFVPACYEKDKAFISLLCAQLEQRGLADIVPPKTPGFKKKRIKKVFVSGDVISRKDLRDLPLPALVRIPAETRRDDSEVWVSTTVDIVIFEFGPGFMLSARCVDASLNTSCGVVHTGKEDLDGAIFIRKWDGTSEEKTCERQRFYRNAVNKGLILVLHTD